MGSNQTQLINCMLILVNTTVFIILKALRTFGEVTHAYECALRNNKIFQKNSSTALSHTNHIRSRGLG